MLADRPLLLDRTPRKQFAYSPGERGNVFGVVHETTFSRALSSQSASVGVGQAFLFGSLEGGFFDQHSLTLVASA
jgi:hypothetical protein